MGEMDMPHEETLHSPSPDSEAVLKLSLDLDIAEYGALMNRASYFITVQAGLWSLVAIYLAFIAQLCKPEGVTVDIAFAHLRVLPLQRALMLWGNLVVLGLILIGCSQFLVEQYKITLYVEGELRKRISARGVLGSFWGYERALMSKRPTRFSTYWEFAISTAGSVVLSAVCAWLWPFTFYDWFGLGANLIMLAVLCYKSHKASATRREWERSLR